jgi:hypothetical protein
MSTYETSRVLQRASRTWNHMRVLCLFVALTVGVAVAAPGCSTPGNLDAVVSIRTPDRAAFASVSPALIRSCGTLDCHGSRLRNMRLFGYSTGRLLGKDAPLSAGTTDAELDENYRGVVGLEPEVMTAVVASGGADVQRLSLFRKGRGLDNHKGGARMSASDPLDKCLVSWLAGKLDTDSCNAAQ